MKNQKSLSKESFDIEKIKRFTQQELDKLSKLPSNMPLCYQLGSDVLVGNFRVNKIDDYTWTVVKQDTTSIDFFNRKNAIFYCVALYKKQYHLANDMKAYDNLLNRLESDARIYRNHYKKANDSNEMWKKELYSARYLETMDRIAQIKKEIKKLLNSLTFS